jgi:diguanylate cyclase (GGDEF)-like protein
MAVGQGSSATKKVHGASSAGADQVASATLALVNYVLRCGGEDALARVLELAGETRPMSVLEDSGAWTSGRQATKLLAAAGEVLDDPEIGFHVGQEQSNRTYGAAIGNLVRAMGSPEEVLRNIGTVTSKFATGRTAEALEVSRGHAVLAFRSEVPIYPKLWCDYNRGLLSKTTLPFGLPLASVDEDECQAEGGQRCVYRISWDPDAMDDPDVEKRALLMKLEAMTQRYEALQSAASDLVSTDDVSSVLSAIAERAGTAVRATAYILAVQPSQGGQLLIHGSGLADADAQEIAQEILAEDPDDRGGSRLIVDVASGRHHYGRFAALYPDGAGGFVPEERRLLAAYARHAAAALEAATALQEARIAGETSAVLLGLARSLAEPATPEELARRLAEAVPTVVGCDTAVVFLWEAGRDSLVVRAAHGFDPVLADRMMGYEVGAGTPAMRAWFAANRAPVFADGTQHKLVRGMLEFSGLAGAYLVPILSRGELWGLIAAGVRSLRDPVDSTSPVWDRLAGLSDQAATALENSHLLERVRELAFRDALTGLPNRRLFEDRVSQALALSRRHSGSVAVMFVDVDRFKTINDSLGHEMGDQLLCLVAQRLSGTLRSSDTVARMGGDEFTVLLPEVVNPGDVTIVAEKVLGAFVDPFCLGSQRVFVTASVGIAVSPDDGDRFDLLLRNADAAMYSAKARGRATYRFYASQMNAAAAARLSLEGDLHNAIERHELEVYYQPQIEVAGGRIVGVEALVRWRHPELGLLAPDEFIPLAEETGMVTAIDRWVLEEACAKGYKWSHKLPVRIAVNISGRHFVDPGFTETFLHAISRSGLDPHLVELEITEAVAAREPKDVIAMLEKMRVAGVSVAIDDFGTGYSILTRLRQLPADRLKIDKSFIAEIVAPSSAAPIVSAIIGMGHGLGLEVIAEGVETTAQERFLTAHGCDCLQGFLYSKPLPLREIEALLMSQARFGTAAATPLES